MTGGGGGYPSYLLRVKIHGSVPLKMFELKLTTVRVILLIPVRVLSQQDTLTGTTFQKELGPPGGKN